MYNSESINIDDQQILKKMESGEFRVLLVMDQLIHQKSEFTLSGVNFYCTDFKGVFNDLKSGSYDAVMILYKDDLRIENSILDIKNITRKANIPFLLYSTEQMERARSLAIRYNFDDYHYGKITNDIKKKLEIIIRSKKKRNAKITRQEGEPPVNVWKRSFDVMVASSVIIVISPILLLVALIIKAETPGPIFYVSKRAGKNYKVFNFIKFRSMYQDADARLNKVSSHNQYGNGIFIKIKNDPRVTPFGKFLRKTSLDEIPQLINVIKGDMSIVGNRPLPLYEARQLTKDKAAQRFLAPAGVTGLWQVTKRGKDDMSDDERINLDIEYARKYSLWYDLRLIFNTIPAMIQKEAV